MDADWRSGRFGERVRLQLFKPQLKVRIMINNEIMMIMIMIIMSR